MDGLLKDMDTIDFAKPAAWILTAAFVVLTGFLWYAIKTAISILRDIFKELKSSNEKHSEALAQQTILNKDNEKEHIRLDSRIGEVDKKIDKHISDFHIKK